MILNFVFNYLIVFVMRN